MTDAKLTCRDRGDCPQMPMCLSEKRCLNAFNLRCYICGKRVQRRFVVLAMNTDVDRVFVACVDGCVSRVEDEKVMAAMVEVVYER